MLGLSLASEKPHAKAWLPTEGITSHDRYTVVAGGGE